MTILEELIALGGNYFLNVGTARGLKQRGVYLCTKAFRDEGTSYHYTQHGRCSYPDKALTLKLGTAIKETEMHFDEGATWTIDAPYRETKLEVNQYSALGVATVEMEVSALFAVAKYRKAKVAAVWVISDILGNKWLFRFHRFHVRELQCRTIDAAVTCLKKIK